MSEIYGESVNDRKIEEHLEKNVIGRDDYKKLNQENENYRQELHVLRLKLETSDAIIRDLQDSGETLEAQFKEYKRMALVSSSEKEEKYKDQQREYKSRIADLETNQVKSELEIEQLQKELKKYEDLVNKQPCHLAEKDILLYEEKLVELTMLLEKEKEVVLEKEDYEKKLMYKFAHLETEHEELQCILKITKKELEEKNEELENALESVRELTVTLVELEAPNMTPASDTCKGNSLFAEVEDRRQILLDKTKVLLSKYNETKQALTTAMAEVKLLRTERISRKWETDLIDTLQGKEDLLNKYKSRIIDLENKLKIEMKKNEQVDETQTTDNSFNYAQSLLAAKRKELKELNEKLEKQAMQMLVQDDVNDNISRQLRHWQSKAAFLESQIRTVKEQLKLQNTSDNKILLKSIENYTFPGNINSKKTNDDPFMSLHRRVSSSETADEESSTEVPKNSVVDSANKEKEFRRVVNFASDTKNSESKPLKKQANETRTVVDFTSDPKSSESKSLKKQAKQRDYPVIVYKDDDTFSVS